LFFGFVAIGFGIKFFSFLLYFKYRKLDRYRS